MTYKLTIDVDLMEAVPDVPGMAILKQWKEEGRIGLVDAAASKSLRQPVYTWPGAPTPLKSDNKPMWGRRHQAVIIKKSGKADVKSISAILFPNTDHSRLNMDQINSVAHLLKHHSTKNEIFVTLNKKDFIDEGRREILQAQLGIVVMTPEETVQSLRKLQGWNADGDVVKKVDCASKKLAKKKKAQSKELL